MVPDILCFILEEATLVEEKHKILPEPPRGKTVKDWVETGINGKDEDHSPESKIKIWYETIIKDS